MIRQRVCFAILIILCSCSKTEEVTNQSLLESCDDISDAAILTSEEKDTACIFFDVFRYRNELFTLCQCCICDKAPVAMDCNGDSLCEDYSCMDSFFRQADYLFSIK